MVAKLQSVKAPPAPRKLELACGKSKVPGYKGIDISPDVGADIVHDLFEFPWPVKTSSVSEIVCNHFVEHIPDHYHTDDGRTVKDVWFKFFDEMYRILKKGGTARFTHPYVMSGRAFWDPTHVRFIHEVTWYYLDRSWREAQGLDHYPLKGDFEVMSVDGNGLSDEHMSRSAEQQLYQRTHMWNIVPDLTVVIKARK